MKIELSINDKTLAPTITVPVRLYDSATGKQLKIVSAMVEQSGKSELEFHMILSEKEDVI